MGLRRREQPLYGANQINRFNTASRGVPSPPADKPPTPRPKRIQPAPIDKRRARHLAAKYSAEVSNAALSLMTAPTPEARQQFLTAGQSALEKISRTVNGAAVKNDKKAARRIYKSSKGVQRAATAYVGAYGHWYKWIFEWRLAQAEKKARGSRISFGKG